MTVVLLLEGTLGIMVYMANMVFAKVQGKSVLSRVEHVNGQWK